MMRSNGIYRVPTFRDQSFPFGPLLSVDPGFVTILFMPHTCLIAFTVGNFETIFTLHIGYYNSDFHT